VGPLCEPGALDDSVDQLVPLLLEDVFGEVGHCPCLRRDLCAFVRACMCVCVCLQSAIACPDAPAVNSFNALTTQVAEEKAVSAIAFKSREARKSSSFDSFNLLARVIGPAGIARVLELLKETLLTVSTLKVCGCMCAW
jgi:hypothetical protein